METLDAKQIANQMLARLKKANQELTMPETRKIWMKILKKMQSELDQAVFASLNSLPEEAFRDPVLQKNRQDFFLEIANMRMQTFLYEGYNHFLAQMEKSTMARLRLVDRWRKKEEQKELTEAEKLEKKKVVTTMARRMINDQKTHQLLKRDLPFLLSIIMNFKLEK